MVKKCFSLCIFPLHFRREVYWLHPVIKVKKWVQANEYGWWKNAEEDARRLITCYNACEGMDNPEMEIAVLRAKVADMEGALEAAAASMETIERMAGRDKYMEDMSQVRGYAANRAKAARETMKAKDKVEEVIASAIKAKAKK
jgi:hypothetical protein